MGIIIGKVVKLVTPPRCVRDGMWTTEVFVNVNDNEFMVSINGCTKLEVMTKSKVGADVMILEESNPVPRDITLNTISSVTITKGAGKQPEPIENDSSFLRKELVDFFKENPPIPLNYINDNSIVDRMRDPKVNHIALLGTIARIRQLIISKIDDDLLTMNNKNLKAFSLLLEFIKLVSQDQYTVYSQVNELDQLAILKEVRDVELYFTYFPDNPSTINSELQSLLLSNL